MQQPEESHGPRCRPPARRHRAMLAGVMAITLSSMLLPAGVLAQGLPTLQPQLSRAEIESGISAEVQRVVNAQRRMEGQGAQVTVRASLNPPGDVLTLNLSAEYVPRYYGAELEDLLHELATTAEEWLRARSPQGDIPVRRVRFLFAGRDVFDHFPQDRPAAPVRPKEEKDSQLRAGPVVLGAGHGIYYHYGFKDWRAQRDPSNGITEDFVTPGYVAELSTWLSARSGAASSLARSTSSEVHAPSGEPWWKIGARYNLEVLYPENPEIWRCSSNQTVNLRERNDDICSRPLYANHIGAGTLIHIHTNAGPAGASGTRAFFHSGREPDQKLADNVLCYMGELIRAKPGYESYTVPSKASARDNLGENSRANMPSVIIEVGFHTNASDAAAIQDPTFRTAAMKGVEKGYRLVDESKPCELFEIARIPDVTGPQNAPIPVRVHYRGYPQFAVTAKVEVVTCPSGWTCNGGTVTYPDKLPSPLGYNFTCTTSGSLPAATFGLRTTLTDADDVKPEPVEHKVTCTPTGTTRGDPKSIGKPRFGLEPRR